MHSVPLGFSIKEGSNATRTNANSFFVDRNHSWFFDETQYKSSLKYANHVQITTPRTKLSQQKMVVFIILEHFLMFNWLNGFWSLWCMHKQFPAITERLISMKSFLFTLNWGLKVVAIFLKYTSLRRTDLLTNGLHCAQHCTWIQLELKFFCRFISIMTADIPVKVSQEFALKLYMRDRWK